MIGFIKCSKLAYMPISHTRMSRVFEFRNGLVHEFYRKLTKLAKSLVNITWKVRQKKKKIGLRGYRAEQLEQVVKI